MGQILIDSIFLALGCTFVLLQRLYSVIPLYELRRLSRQGDERAQSLYKVAAYKRAGRLFIWTCVMLLLAIGLALITAATPLFIAIPILALSIVMVSIVIPSLAPTSTTIKFAALVAPPLAWLIARFYMPLSWLSNHVGRYRYAWSHTQLYELDDLLDLLHRQAQQFDNRISSQDLAVADHALRLQATTAQDVLTSRDDMFTVDADAAIGPILLDQLHAHGQDAYLVHKDSKDNIVGTLQVSDAMRAKEGGRVLDFVRPDVTTVANTSTLKQVIDALRKSEHQLVIVLNEFEDFMGLITLEHVMHYMFGREHQDTIEQDTVASQTIDTSSSGTEVVE